MQNQTGELVHTEPVLAGSKKTTSFDEISETEETLDPFTSEDREVERSARSQSEFELSTEIEREAKKEQETEIGASLSAGYRVRRDADYITVGNYRAWATMHGAEFEAPPLPITVSHAIAAVSDLTIPADAASVEIGSAALDNSGPDRLRLRRETRLARAGCGDIELEIDGVAVRVRRGAEAGMVVAVIKALKAVR